ncbi:hypothetical protein DPMN_030521 [Dreissena polymorpha]|uniref:Uncharacterized protein n=1 Tax=Dreissena polymorpha TaxID=45954 RepID=A0A9D4H8K1_DREPO|nr:hypothetical protein DPMN_103714 [Dreissena polymorpha]KAH3867395.1 hypothetical protein DPMN_030521 [Dreissena polymorpha]
MRPSALQPKFFGSGHPSSLAQLVSRLGHLDRWVSVVGWPYGNQCRMDAFYLAHFLGKIYMILLGVLMAVTRSQHSYTIYLCS